VREQSNVGFSGIDLLIWYGQTAVWGSVYGYTRKALFGLCYAVDNMFYTKSEPENIAKGM
jgi:hypothetical protein